MLKASPADFDKASSTLLARMRAESDPAALAELSSAVAILRGKLPRGLEEEATGIVVKRLAAERDPEAMRPMASAVDKLDEGVSKAKANKFASMLVARMRTEPNAESLLNLALGFTSLAEHVDDDARAGELAAPLLARLLTESRPDALRPMAFSRAAGAADLASRLAARAVAEPDQNLLRAYGEVLGSMPVGSLSMAQVRGLEPMSRFPTRLARSSRD